MSFIQEIDICIDQTLSKLEEGYQIDAFLWHQGESDQRKGKDYYDNLKAVVTYVRKQARIIQSFPLYSAQLPEVINPIAVRWKQVCAAWQRKIQMLI